MTPSHSSESTCSRRGNGTFSLTPKSPRNRSSALMASGSSSSDRLQWFSQGCGQIRPSVAGNGLTAAMTLHALANASAVEIPILSRWATVPIQPLISPQLAQPTWQGAVFSTCFGLYWGVIRSMGLKVSILVAGNLPVQVPDPVRHGLKQVDCQQRIFPDARQQGFLVHSQHPGLTRGPHRG